MIGLREWMRKASEPILPAQPVAEKDAGELVDGEVIKEIKGDDHHLKNLVLEIKDICEEVLKSDLPVDWWEISNALAALTDDLLGTIEEELEAGEE